MVCQGRKVASGSVSPQPAPSTESWEAVVHRGHFSRSTRDHSNVPDQPVLLAHGRIMAGAMGTAEHVPLQPKDPTYAAHERGEAGLSPCRYHRVREPSQIHSGPRDSQQAAEQWYSRDGVCLSWGRLGSIPNIPWGPLQTRSSPEHWQV